MASPLLLIGRASSAAVEAASGTPPIACGQHAPRKAFCLRVDSFNGRRNDANVSPELEDQVVDIHGSDGTQRGQFRRRLLLVEDVERPVADRAALQMRVGEPGAEVGANDDRFDAGGLLLWP